jgi:uncharacterized protein
MMAGEYTQEDGEKLLNLARQSIEHEFHPEIKLELPDGKQFIQARGVFVTLTLNGELRGCIGLPYPIKSVSNAVIEAAKGAAFSDLRFERLDEGEIEKVKIEISILTMPQETSSNDINIGEDGLICNCLGYQGLLLPQVAKEYSWDRIGFLENLCRKAGLPKDAWQDNNFKLWKFQAQIFKE